ncbi:MAG: aminoacyl-tRNA hydrolase [Clostridia bacterium]|nr:aminoacyl-tRNA hydrolase [Clostridia bacterium]
MYIIVGLGNPEEKYFKTFHNMGWNAAGDVAAKFGVKFKKKECSSVVAEANINGQKVIIARPVTYMNNSGEAVKQLLAKYKATPSDLVVIYDDYDLPKGKLRIRPEGSAGTHNGMRSVVAEINSEKFTRIRIGIRDAEVNIPIINYVLSEVKKEDYSLFVSACEKAADAAIALVKGVPTEQVMTEFNG